jgi:NADH-quinone oxidoreductase subunit L
MEVGDLNIILLGYLIPFLPLLAFIIIVSMTKKFRLTSAIISISAIFISFLLSLILLYFRLKDTNAHNFIEYNLPWLSLGNFNLNVGILINNLTAIMLIVVTTVSLLVQIYSIGYMHGDDGFSRFFAFISLFSFSMLGIVVSNNLLQLYIFWELVGLCSYLLIGFWYHKPEASDAAKKAFVVTRFGDFGFLLGILILTYNAGTFNFIEIEHYLKAGNMDAGLLTIVILLLFCGAVGKSGQFPLHVWLPDAMEGPTPVSALIHAATMVAAGVFMVARLFDIFSLSSDALKIIAYIGGFTAIFSATIALTQDDIKRVLAYSTLSQLGYMMLALGVSGYTAGMFHLYTHAFFKALLFLCAGSVIHAMHTNNIWEMGGLHKKMPITSITFLIAAFAISGIFPLSGFWSKDEILVNVYESGNKILYYAAVITAFLTAFYMFRLYFVTFTGTLKDEHAHESPAVMTVPLILLAILSIISGFVGIPGTEKSIYNFLYTGEHPHEAAMNLKIAISSNIIALSGILFAFIIYGLKIIKPETMKKITGPFYVISKNKYFIDEIYLFLIRKIFFAITEFVKWFDRHIVDGAVNLVAFLCRWAGAKLRLTINGNVQSYALIIFSGMILIIAVFAIYNPEALRIFGGR